jgi:hypothetical protein
MDNSSIVDTFVESVLFRKSVLLANAELRIEPVGNVLQLWSKQDGLLSSASLSSATPFFKVKSQGCHSILLHDTLIAHQVLPTELTPVNGYYAYEPAKVPKGCKLNCKDGLLFLQAWWTYKTKDAQVGNLGMLLWHDQAWHPIQYVECDRGMLKVSVWSKEISLHPEHRVAWLQKIRSSMTEHLNGASDAFMLATVTNPSEQRYMTTATKYIGNYLVEAGLISSAQVSLILSDQATTKMRFGEIVVNRGWLKTQTIEFLMAHVISPKQNALRFEEIDLEPRQLEPRQLEPERSHLLQEQSVSVHSRETFVL